MILKDKVSIITGGSRGIGKTIALAFGREGSHSVLTSRTLRELEGTKEELRGVAGNTEIFRADVSKEEEVANLVAFTLQRFGTIDVLVNCAGIYGPIGLVTDIDSENWMEAININLYGTFLCIKAVLPKMIEKRRGKIINSSGGGATSPLPRFSAYGAAKAAVVRLTETLAEEVKKYNIDINAIAPGPVNTRLLDQVLEVGEAAGKDLLARAVRQKQEGGVPPDKAAELAVFLASSESDGLTGRLISAAWDNWKEIPRYLNKIMSSDIYTLRRITAGDRGYNW